MAFCLENKNELLALYRKFSPIDETAKARIMRSDTLRLREAICAHYEINPFMPPEKPISTEITANIKIIKKDNTDPFIFNEIRINNMSQLLHLLYSLSNNDHLRTYRHLILETLSIDKESLDYSTFQECVDLKTFALHDLFNRSLIAEEVETLGENNPDIPITKSTYIEWAIAKGFLLPDYMTEQFSATVLPPLRNVDDIKTLAWEKMPLPVLKSFIFNSIAQIKKRNNPDIPISAIINSKLIQLFASELSSLSTKVSTESDSSIRKHIKNQFPD